jgi:outer membrane protein TolC
MKRLVGLIMCCGLVTAGEGQITISYCQERAQANYPLIKEYDLIKKSTDYTLSNANKAYLPQVSLNLIGGIIAGGFPTSSQGNGQKAEKNNTQLIGIAQVNQTIWDGGATRVQKDIARANSEVETANIDVSIYSVRENINQVYFGILVIDEQLKQLQISNENLIRSLENIKLSKDNGLAYTSDVDEVRSEILNLEQKRLDFVFTRKGYVKMLSFLIGQALNDTTQLEKPVLIGTVDSVINNRPELKLYKSQLKLIEAQSATDKVNLMPKIGVIGAGVMLLPGVSLGNSKLKGIGVLGLGVSWSMGNLYTNSNNKNLTRLSMDKISDQRDAFLFTNHFQLMQAASEIDRERAILSKDEEIVALKGEITKSYQIRFDNGMCSMNDLVTSINKESEARSNRALHLVQLLMSTYNYMLMSGN